MLTWLHDTSYTYQYTTMLYEFIIIELPITSILPLTILLLTCFLQFVFYGKRIGVRFTLLGPATIKGDVDNNIQQVSIGDAKDRIVEAFTDGIFQVYFMPDPVTVR